MFISDIPKHFLFVVVHSNRIDVSIFRAKYNIIGYPDSKIED